MLLPGQSNVTMASKKSTIQFWTDEETEFMLQQVQKLNILNFMDGRKTRNVNLFEKIADAMEEEGFARTPEQVRIKWKNTRTAYNNAKRNNGTSGQGRVSCPHYELMEDLIGGRPLSQATQPWVDVGGVEEVDIKTEKEDNDEQHLDSLTERTSSHMPGTSYHPTQPRRRQRNPDLFAQLYQEVRATRRALLQQLRESDEHLRELTNVMKESRADHNLNMAAVLEGINSLKPAPSPHIQHPPFDIKQESNLE